MSGMMQELQGPCMPYCLCSQRAALRAHCHPMHQLPPHRDCLRTPACCRAAATPNPPPPPAPLQPYGAAVIYDAATPRCQVLCRCQV